MGPISLLIPILTKLYYNFKSTRAVKFKHQNVQHADSERPKNSVAGGELGLVGFLSCKYVYIS